MYDVIIIGAGPAGLSAAIYAARREMKVLVLGKEIGGQIMWAAEIENYPGFSSIASFDLIERMKKQVNDLKVEIKIEDTKQIEQNQGNVFSVYAGKEVYQGKTVILALGLLPRRLAIPDEEKYSGKGVSYCANCDGPFFRNKTVGVVGGGNSALDAAEVLSKIADRVYLIHRRQDFRAFEGLVDEVRTRKNVEWVLDCNIKEIKGEGKVEGIVVENCAKKEIREIKLDGLFIEIGRIAHTDLAKDLVKRDENDQILIDEKCRTSRPGVFAAGDVTTVPYKQISIACGQGTIAALAAYEYLQLKQGKTPNLFFDRGKKRI